MGVRAAGGGWVCCEVDGGSGVKWQRKKSALQLRKTAYGVQCTAKQGHIRVAVECYLLKITKAGHLLTQQMKATDKSTDICSTCIQKLNKNI